MAKRINIPRVTGNVVITATATPIGGDNDPITTDAKSFMTHGKRINQTTLVIENDPACWATVDPVTVVSGETYQITLDATWCWVYSFDDTDKFRSILVSGSSSNPQSFKFTANTTKIRFGCYDPNNQLTYCTMTKADTSTYTIARNLNNCNISNTSTTVNKGASYSAIISVNNGYVLSNITVTMGGNDISSTVVNGNNINIPNVTGDIVITVTTTATSSGGGSNPNTLANMTYGKGINLTTHIITDNPACWATVDPVTVVSGKTYKIKLDATWAWVYSFDENNNYKSQLVQGTDRNPQTFTFTANSTKIKYGCYDPNKQLTYCTLTQVSGGTTPTPDPTPSGDLNGTYMLFGDSICYGGGTNGYGYPQAIKAQQPSITMYNYGVNGACVSRNSSYDVSYMPVIAKMDTVSGYADYIIFEGGVNDSWGNRNPKGSMNSSTDTSASYANSLNEYTFAGALEKCFYKAKQKWPGKKLFYVIPHRINEAYSNPYFDLGIQICNKWGVIVIDLRNGEMQGSLISQYTTDGTHPNRAGYDRYYAPPIIAVLKANK